MSRLMIELSPRAEQTVFNLRRWSELLADPGLNKIEGRIETDRHGRLIMSPPPIPRHGQSQFKIGSLLEKLMRAGEIVMECPISTADGVKAADVAWASPECWRELGNRACFVRSPEICVEIMSPSNTEGEIREKMALYFDAGASEVWICEGFGKMNFFGAGSARLGRSEVCPDFPGEI